MASIQAFRDIANNTSVSDRRYVYFANEGKKDKGQILVNKQTLCFNAAGKPRNFTRPSEKERQAGWAEMRQQLKALVAAKLDPGTDAFKKIEKTLFGKVVDGQYDPKAAMKPLRKRDVVKVLTLMDKAINDGMDKGDLKTHWLDRAFSQLDLALAGQLGPASDNILLKTQKSREDETDGVVANISFVPENRKDEAKRILDGIVSKAVSQTLPLGGAEIAKLKEKFLSDMGKAGFFREEPGCEKCVYDFDHVEVIGQAALKREIADAFFDCYLEEIFADFDSANLKTEDPNLKNRRDNLRTQMQFLKDVASFAFGKYEGAKGGKGYMALDLKGTPVKFLTHSRERSDFKSGGVSLAKRESVNNASETLRNSLLSIASGLGEQVCARVDQLLALQEISHGLKVLSREQVARAISEIAKTFKDGDGNVFKWSDVKRASTIERTTVEGIFKTEKYAPIPHDEANFPENITEQELLDAYNNASPESIFTNSGSGLVPVKVTINGRNYIMKMADEREAGWTTGKAKVETIINGHKCDMAYRAGGIGAPDSKIYQFGSDGNKRVFKLTEFVEGKRLDQILKSGTVAEQEAARLEILKGYPLDCLFGNWDVIGTNLDITKHYTNIIIGNDGRAYRIDNEGAFSLKGLVGENKKSSYAVEKYPAEGAGKHFGGYEDWTNNPGAKNGGWTSHKWIDDCFTLNQNPDNAPIYDERMTTADIFLAARNIDIDAVVDSLEDEEIRDVVQRTGEIMKQMANLADEAITTGKESFAEISTKLEKEYVKMKKKAGVKGL